MARRANAKQPRYQEIAGVLRGELAAEVFPVGGPFPKELDLCERFGCSRFTIRNALKELEVAGLVERRKAVGTIVRASTPESAYVQSLASAEEIAGVALLALQVDGADMDQLKGMCDHLRDAGREVVALLASVNDGKPLLAAMVSKECIEHCGLVASELVKAVAPLIEGGGGGRRHLATAGGKDPAGIPRALEEFRGRVRERLRS